MKKKAQHLYSKIDGISNKGAGAFEWIVFALFAIICFIFFCHQDILITAGHSIEYLNGHIADFYSACKNTDGTYAANYLPSTFILFAIWNIPMKLFRLVPAQFGDWNTVFMFWNKLLPTGAYFISGLLIYKLCINRFSFDKKKSALTMFLALSTPMAFFTQFFFCQYDIFTVLFMLLGMYFYFRKEPKARDYILFALFFGIATTFKYFALVIFVVLLLLRTKDIFKDIALLIVSVIPFGTESLFYLLTDRKAFIKSVFDFSALDYTNGFTIDLGEVSINLMYVFLLVLIAFSYFTQAKDFNELVGYGMFYACGVCFGIFGLMLWHPQWLLFIVPFWVIGMVINKNNNILLWIDALLGIVFLIYIVNQFSFVLEGQGLLRYGILMDLLRFKNAPSVHMSDIVLYKEADTLFSVISAILLIGFIFRHPKFNFDKINKTIKDGRFIVNIRFVAFAAAFSALCFAILPSFANNSDLLWKNYGEHKMIAAAINDETFIDEYTRLEKSKIECVYIVCDTIDKSEEKATIMVDIIDTKTDEILAHGTGKEKNIKNGSEKYTKLTLDKPFIAQTDTTYKLRFHTDSDHYISIFYKKTDSAAAACLRSQYKNYSSSYVSYKGEDINGKNLVMKLTGDDLQ